MTGSRKTAAGVDPLEIPETLKCVGTTAAAAATDSAADQTAAERPKVEPAQAKLIEEVTPSATEVELDADEREFRSMRRDVAGVKGSSSSGVVAISVGKIPEKNAFFRTSRDFHMVTAILDHPVGMENKFFAVTADMVGELQSIGITAVADYSLFLTQTTNGAYRIVLVRQANIDGEQNEYHRTKEIGLVRGYDEWVRLFTDLPNHCYKVFTAPHGRFSENPTWLNLKPAKIFRLAFRDRGNLIDSREHTLFKKLAARDSD
jgi:hypothetical protein